MLVSVTERTREIGLRMAVGGRRENVRNQFLMESLVLCLAGGIVGLVAGVGGTYAVGATEPDILVKVEPVVAAIAIGSSAIVGVVFGFYPAHQASRLNPIEALRFE
ncbi:MAG: ABC transporter permease [Maricaulaceae bacterium]